MTDPDTELVAVAGNVRGALDALTEYGEVVADSTKPLRPSKKETTE